MLELIIIVTLGASALYSAVEITFVSADRLRVRLRATRGDQVASRTLDLMKRADEFLTVTLIGNNVANVTFASVAAIYLGESVGLGSAAILFITAGITLVVGEIVPKSAGRELANSVVGLIRPVYEASRVLFYPLIIVVRAVSKRILSLFGASSIALGELITREEIKRMLRGTIRLPRIFEFGEIPVRHVMIPRTEMVSMNINTPVREARQIFADSGLSKIPVYSDTIDTMVGFVRAKNLFANPAALAEIVEDVSIVPESKRCAELLFEFKERNRSIAIVVNEFGGTAGLVTVEDIFEEIVGDIRDEHHDERLLIERIDDRTLLVDGRMPLKELDRLLKIRLASDTVATVGGLVIERIGRVPRAKEIIRIEPSCEVEILQSTPTRITMLKIRAM